MSAVGTAAAATAAATAKEREREIYIKANWIVVSGVEEWEVEWVCVPAISQRRRQR